MTELLTTEQAATIVGIGRRHLHTWAATRGVHCVRHGRRWLYPAADIRAALQPASGVAGALRMHRFARNPLNRV